MADRGPTLMQQYVFVHSLLGSRVENVNLAFASTNHTHAAIGGHCCGIDELPILPRQVPAEFFLAKVVLIEFELEFTFPFKISFLGSQPQVKKIV